MKVSGECECGEKGDDSRNLKALHPYIRTKFEVHTTRESYKTARERDQVSRYGKSRVETTSVDGMRPLTDLL